MILFFYQRKKNNQKNIFHPFLSPAKETKAFLFLPLKKRNQKNRPKGARLLMPGPLWNPPAQIFARSLEAGAECWKALQQRIRALGPGLSKIFVQRFPLKFSIRKTDANPNARGLASKKEQWSDHAFTPPCGSVGYGACADAQGGSPANRRWRQISLPPRQGRNWL